MGFQLHKSKLMLINIFSSVVLKYCIVLTLKTVKDLNYTSHILTHKLCVVTFDGRPLSVKGSK